MQRFSVALLIGVTLILFSGCDSAGYERNGLELTVVNQTTVDWNVKRPDNGDTWRISGDDWYREFRCYSSGGCSSEFIFKPAVNPPDGCRGWKKVTRTIRIPYDYNRSRKIELNEYDLDPLPRGCVDKNVLDRVRSKYQRK